MNSSVRLQKKDDSGLSNIWLSFVPFFLYSYIPAIIGGNIYWVIWSFYSLLITFSLPRIVGFLDVKTLNRVFLVYSLIVSGIILLEVFGPGEVREYLSYLKISENVSDVDEYLNRFVGRYSGIIADVPSAGCVLGLSLSLLLTYHDKAEALFEAKSVRAFLWVLMPITFFTMIFSSRTWFIMISIYLVAFMIWRKQLIELIGLVFFLVISFFLLIRNESVNVALKMLQYVLPMFTLRFHDVNALFSLGQEYHALDSFLRLHWMYKVFGTGLPANYESMQTDIGFLRYAIGLGIVGTVLLLYGYVNVVTSLIKKYRFDSWSVPIIFGTVSLIIYNFKGTSLHGLYIFPIYILVLVLCIRNMEVEHQGWGYQESMQFAKDF